MVNNRQDIIKIPILRVSSSFLHKGQSSIILIQKLLSLSLVKRRLQINFQEI